MENIDCVIKTGTLRKKDSLLKDVNGRQFETKQIHSNCFSQEYFGSRNIPIFNTGAFSLEKGALTSEGQRYSYTRNSNPTIEAFENIMTVLENGDISVAFSSGMAAIFCTIITLVSPGDSLIVSKQLNGGVYDLFTKIIAKFDVKISFFDSDNPEEIMQLLDIKTKAVYFDSIGNPMGNIPDFNRIISICHNCSIPVVIDK